MNYKYNEEKECFIREDGLGKKYWINSSEAQRIMTLYDLGNSIGEIRNKITFSRVSIGPVIIPKNGIKEILGRNDIVLVYPIPVTVKIPKR